MDGLKIIGGMGTLRFQDVKWSAFHNEARKPVLVVYPAARLSDNTVFSLKIIPTATSLFTLSKLNLERNNIRSLSQATPKYNSSILEDMFIEDNADFIKRTFTGCKELREALLLLKKRGRDDNGEDNDLLDALKAVGQLGKGFVKSVSAYHNLEFITSSDYTELVQISEVGCADSQLICILKSIGLCNSIPSPSTPRFSAEILYFSIQVKLRWKNPSFFLQFALALSGRQRMGLLSIIRKIKRKEKEMRILMVGLDNSGKTTIVMKINGEDTSIISPTLGFNIKTISYQKYTLNIWDVGGQKTIRSYWRNYFEQTDGLVWVVDSSDLRRLSDCKYELDNLLKEERLSGASLLIFANKQDIQGSLSSDEIAKVLNLEAMDKSRHWKIVGCSAYTGEGLLEGMYFLTSLYCTGLNTDEQAATTRASKSPKKLAFPAWENRTGIAYAST
ncbi:UNVERIFIED_CONTAM: ADP-ribosylation factor-like protein 2 [Sesamum latifolium]|uniref:ADP-ribosylation factor-like protein 2 n=1 Tax=Sesamum latifolium TaxID=2727402 RepID=A0AAW2X9Q4_9LAMI